MSTKLFLKSDIPGCHSVGDWQLAPEGAAIHPGERTAVIADVHLGYEWARGLGGDCVPAHSLAETLKQLGSLLARSSINRLVVAGDLVECPRRCTRTAADLARLAEWVNSRGVSLVLLEGNHDRSLAWMTRNQPRDAGLGVEGPLLRSSFLVAGWTIAHGHRPESGRRLITGHHHPVLRVAGRAAPCFLAGCDRIILPAFSQNAAGLDVFTARIPEAWRRHSLRCLASTGTDLLDFGLLDGLSARRR
jgi:putative SbcD/Mre11-related phosphoesterase